MRSTVVRGRVRYAAEDPGISHCIVFEAPLHLVRCTALALEIS